VDAEQIKLTNVKILPGKLPVFSLYDSRNVTMKDISGPESEGVFMRLQGDKTREIHLKGKNISRIKERIDFGTDLKPDAVTFTD